MNIKLSRGNEIVYQTNSENRNLKKIMKNYNELTKEEKELIDSGSMFYGEDSTKNKNLKKIMKNHNELTKEEKELIDSGSMFYGEDSTKNKNLKKIMKNHNELTKEEKELIDSRSMFYGERAIKNNMNITSQNGSNNINIKINNLLKSKKAPCINTEILKEYVFKYYRFIYCGELRCYDKQKGYYRALTYHEAVVMINSIVPKEFRFYLKAKDLNETYKSIKYDHRIQLLRNDQFVNGYINCLNGIVNLKNIINKSYPNIESHREDYYFLNCVNANYLNNYSIEKTNFYRFIFTVTEGNLELIKLIKQVLGYIVSNLNNAKKAFILYGKSNSGKSVFLNLISSLCGEENISNIELQNLSIEKYTAELFGKLVNICSELPDNEIRDTGIFKALVSETDKVTARKVYGQPFSFYNKAKLIFATNNLPEIKGRSYKDNSAFFNRLIIIPFMISIPEEKQDKDLLIKLIEEKDIIFSWAIDGLIEYINNGYIFDEPYISKCICESYRNNDNSISAFINSKCEICSNSYVHMDKLFIAYIKFCEELCYDIPSNKDKKQIKSLIEEKYNLIYRKLNRPEGNKYGFAGLKLKDDI